MVFYDRYDDVVVYKRQGMRISNGDIVYTNPYAADSDGDGLLNGEEIIREFHMFGYDALAQFNPNNIYPDFNTHIVFTKRTNPLKKRQP